MKPLTCTILQSVQLSQEAVRLIQLGSVAQKEAGIFLHQLFDPGLIGISILREEVKRGPVRSVSLQPCPLINEPFKAGLAGPWGSNPSDAKAPRPNIAPHL